MIIDISKYPNYKILNFDLRTPISGVRKIDEEKLEIEIWDYHNEKLLTAPINLVGIDHEDRIIYIQFIKDWKKEEEND